MVVQWLRLYFHYIGYGFNPWLGKFHVPHNVAKKKINFKKIQEKKKKFILSEFWRSEVQTQGPSKVTERLGENPLFASASFQ